MSAMPYNTFAISDAYRKYFLAVLEARSISNEGDRRAAERRAEEAFQRAHEVFLEQDQHEVKQ
jgi:hypothetical protein